MVSTIRRLSNTRLWLALAAALAVLLAIALQAPGPVGAAGEVPEEIGTQISLQDSTDTGEAGVGTTNFTGVVRLVDHNGNGLAGGTVERYLGGWQALPGQTDSTGNLVFSLPNDPTGLSMRMHYQGTYNQQNWAQLGASTFTFQTAQVTVKLKDADGNPLDTGRVTYYAGNAWRAFGTGAVGTSGGATTGGAIAQEMLSGSYPFAMGYNNTRQQRDFAISGPTTDVVFQTGRLSLKFSQPVTWYTAAPVNGYHTLASTGMEFLPGTMTFYLGGASSSCSVDIKIVSGDHLVKSGIVATLRNSAGQPLAGGDATAYAGGWKVVGTTKGQGRTCQVFDGNLSDTTVQMTYMGASQPITQSQPANSVYAFQTPLMVQDTAAPVISGTPADVTVEATSGSGAVVTYTLPTATDVVDGAVPVNCIPDSGSTFALGTTTVNCTATDKHSNTGSASFIVKVQDTTAPTLKVPANITATATSSDGAKVTYIASAYDIVDGVVTPVCSPASGSTFPLGITTTVTCTATDAAGNSDTAQFTVTVPMIKASFLSPLSETAVNMFKVGSTIPVKVTLAGAANPLSNVTIKVVAGDKTVYTETGAITVNDSGQSADDGTNFRYDATSGRYIYNLSTKTGYTVGQSYTIFVYVGGQQVGSVLITATK